MIKKIKIKIKDLYAIYKAKLEIVKKEDTLLLTILFYLGGVAVKQNTATVKIRILNPFSLVFVTVTFIFILVYAVYEVVTGEIIQAIRSEMVWWSIPKK